MTADVAVVDYGMGNLLSVRRALEHCGARVDESDDPGHLLSAPRLVLPGVGAFADGMRGLKERGLYEAIREFASSGKPLLGICLGMQMLGTSSSEFGEHAGLDIIPGRVAPLAPASASGKRYKIPHIGWTALVRPPGLAGWQGSILEGLAEGAAVYVVHSFALEPYDAGHRLADCNYDDLVISAAVRKDNVYGTQFHPEKSGAAGLAILAGFIREG